MIFNWYESMFEKYFTDGKGSVIRFILVYLNQNSTNYEWLSKHPDPSISYFNYDWNANVNGDIPCDSGSRPCYPLWAFLVTLGGVVIIVVIAIIAVVCVRRSRKRSAYHRINVSS